jgi:hypothetical protein
MENFNLCLVRLNKKARNLWFWFWIVMVAAVAWFWPGFAEIRFLSH